MTGIWHIVRPSPTLVTNLHPNPSFGNSITGYSAQALSISLLAGSAYRGPLGLRCTSTTASGYLFWGGISASGVHTVSCMIRGTAHKQYRLVFVTSGATYHQDVVGTGGWQQIAVTATGVSMIAAALYLLNAPDVCDTDAWMLTAGPHTYDYFDGDEGGQWNGTPHASTSTGYPTMVVSLGNIGFDVSLGTGTGFAPVQNTTLPYGIIDGSFYERTITQARTMTLLGSFGAGSLQDFKALRRLIGSYFLPGERVTVRYTGGQRAVEISGYYQDGWGMTQMMGFNEQTGVAFLCPDPYWTHPYVQTSATMSGITSLGDANFIVHRINGLWSPMGNPNGTIRVLAYSPNGILYAGGQFSGGIAAWNRATNTWNTVGNGTNSSVDTILFDAEGDLYIGGAFTQVGGSVTANRVAKYSFATATWSTFGAGFANNVVYALAFDIAGSLYAGGTFTSPQNRLARWDGTSWVAVGGGVDHDVFDIQRGPDNRLYICGTFLMGNNTVVNRVAFLNAAGLLQGLGSGVNGTTYKLRFGPDGRLYACGDFTQAGGNTANRVAVWNGTQWLSMGSGMNNQVRALHVSRDGTVYAGGTFSQADGQPVPNGLAFWTGSAWFPVDVKLPGTAEVYAFLEQDRMLAVGFTTNGSGTRASTLDITYQGTAPTYPVIVITSTAYARLYQLLNVTNGARLFFDVQIFSGETITIDMGKREVISSWRGHMPWIIRPGSTTTRWRLEPGAYGEAGTNRITFYASNSGPSVRLSWIERYMSNDT